MANLNRRGFREILRALKWSLQGIRAAFKYEASFRLEVYLFILLVPAAIYISNSAMQLVALLGSACLVLIIEMINSAIEATVDMVCGDEKHVLAGRAKDMGSAAVFISQLLVLFVWLAVLYENYFPM